MPAVLGAQGDAALASDTFVEGPGCVALLWRRKGGENPAAFIIQGRNRTKAEQCSVTKKGRLLSELGQRLVEICQKYHKEKYRVITISIALRILWWQNIFSDCFCLVESIIS